MKANTPARRTAIGIALMALALSADAAAAGRPADDWNNLARLQPGTIVTVTARGAGRTRYLAAFADPQVLAVVRFIEAQTPERVQHALRALPPGSLAVLPAADIRVDTIRFSHGAVLDGAVKIADLIAFPKDDIVEVELTAPARHGSKGAAVIGAVAGGVAALLVAPAILFHPCGGDCMDEEMLLYATAIGLPVGGGLLGYYAARGAESGVIYHAPPVQPPVLDEAAWQRLRGALPPSMRGDGVPGQVQPPSRDQRLNF